MLVSRHPLLITASVFIGALNDERLLLAMPFLVLWWWPEAESWKKSLPKFLAPGLAVFFGLVFVLLVRAALVEGLIGPGIDDAYQSGGLFSGHFSRIWQPSEWPSLVVMVLLGFRWLWIIPVFAVSFLWRQRGSLRSLVYALSISAVSLATFTVADVSR